MSPLHTILKNALRFPMRTAVIDDRRTTSYGRLAIGAMHLAKLIERETRRPHVGLLLPTGAASPACMLGAWLAGRVPIPFNYLLNKDELAQVIADSEVDTILTAGPMLDFLGGPEVLPAGIKLVRLETTKFSKVPPLRWPRRISDDETAVILYSSGTTGRPKGIMLTHGNLRTNVEGAIAHAEMSSADTFLGVLPQFHSFGLTALTMAPLMLGAKVVYTARFIPKKLLELMRTHRPDIFMAVPSMYTALASVKDANADDFKSIRLCISGGEPLPRAVFDLYRERFAVSLLEGYGLTETTPIVTWSTPGKFKYGAVGRVLPDISVLIVNENDQLVEAGVDGEILVTGPNIMKGYFKQQELTNSVMIMLQNRAGKEAKYFRTGDIGQLDADGFLYITGRKKEMLIIGGLNVFPREIEEVLNRHPSVRDSAVVGRADGVRGEVAVAFVEIIEGATFDESALRAWCRESIAGYKVPREVVRVNELPRTVTGKILRRKVKELLPAPEAG